jgi:response regulator RpfG family c-di-GMP phosphodiesterase/tRNA A-37 threonylcarbamoyl transferase component Bud32
MLALSAASEGLFWTPELDAHRRGLQPAAMAFLDQVLALQLVGGATVERFLIAAGPHLADYSTADLMASALVQAGLMTAYQVDRVQAGTTHGLVLGNYRVLERLGAGAMAVVFLAEHVLLKRRAAVKILPVDEDCPAAVIERFCSEMHVLAELDHPHVVRALDAGHVPAAGYNMPRLLYLVMELVPGGDLEQLVIDHGPVDIPQACTWIRQAAAGLQAAHDRHVIHRDVKPSNLLLTQDRQVKVVDFGLVRQFTSRLTDTRALLGTLEYMPPEQSTDPSSVDGKADIYGLGATLFWLLTGTQPLPPSSNVTDALRVLQTSKPFRARELRPSVSPELDDLIDKMLLRDPQQRPATPLTVMHALLPFCAASTATVSSSPPASIVWEPKRPLHLRKLGTKAVLVVDDEPNLRIITKTLLKSRGFDCDTAADGREAQAAIAARQYDLILLDLNLPDIDGYEVCRFLRSRGDNPNCKVIVISGRGDHEVLAASLPQGADDFIPKPFGFGELEARVDHALRLKEAQDEADYFAGQLALTNQQMEQSLTARGNDVRKTQNALLFAMTKMMESRDGETAGHLLRLQRYSRVLAEGVSAEESWAGLVNGTFLEQLDRCVPLHDIGKFGISEHLLLKPGELTSDERLIMQMHTVIGDQLLEALGREHGQSLAFLGMAAAIVRHHHECYDGRGYPDRLVGEAIPPAARLVALADVYDALRRQRFHKPALDHAQAARIILEDSAGRFDPAVLKAFAERQRQFELIFRDVRT